MCHEKEIMGQVDQIVAIAALVGSLMLVTGGSRFQTIPGARRMQLAAIWVVIFLAVIALARFMAIHSPE